MLQSPAHCGNTCVFGQDIYPSRMCVQAMGALFSQLVCRTVTGSLAASLSCIDAHQLPQWPQRGWGRGRYRAHRAAWQQKSLFVHLVQRPRPHIH